MIYTPKIQKAIDFAIEVYKKQKRKGKDIPHIVHPLGVGLILLGKTTAVPIINKSEFGRVKIPMPPLKTQKQIVAKLSAVQEYKGRLLEQKYKLKELFNSVLHKSMDPR